MGTLKIRHLAFIIFVIVFPVIVSAAEFSRYEGLSGRELADAVRSDFAPVRMPSTLPVDRLLPEDWPEGWWPEPWPGDGSRVTLIVPESWASAPIIDLYNIIAADSEFILCKSDYIPGELSSVTDSGAAWEAGLIEITGIMTNGWWTSADRRGDLARRIMYVALMYPQTLWSARGAMMMAEGKWPLLTTYGRQLLEKWNEDDPVDEREIAETAAIAAAQGNENPFVIFPKLFEYLWGDFSGQAVIPDEKHDRQPLKGSYSRSEDKIIDLYSPYVPDDAQWAIDGVAVGGKTILLDDVTVGVHTISFTAGSRRGKLKIDVAP